MELSSKFQRYFWGFWQKNSRVHPDSFREATRMGFQFQQRSGIDHQVWKFRATLKLGIETKTTFGLNTPNMKHSVLFFSRGKNIVSVSSTVILIVIGNLGNNNNNNNNDQTSGITSDQTWGCDPPKVDESPPSVTEDKSGWIMLELGV